MTLVAGPVEADGLQQQQKRGSDFLLVVSLRRGGRLLLLEVHSDRHAARKGVRHQEPTSRLNQNLLETQSELVL